MRFSEYFYMEHFRNALCSLICRKNFWNIMVDFTFLIGKFSCKIMTTMYRNSNGSSQSSCDIKISNVCTEDTVQIGTSIVF